MDQQPGQNNTIVSLKEEDLALVARYAQAVSEEFQTLFQHNANRFRDGDILLKRFAKAADLVVRNGWPKFDAINETHNELCIAGTLLSSTVPVIETLEYEPPLQGSSKSIDFRAAYQDITVYVDVKTIKPECLDRWEQFVKFNQMGRFPEKVKVILEQDWLGGELCITVTHLEHECWNTQ